MNEDPTIVARQRAAVAAHFERPGAREAARDRVKASMANLSDAERARRSEVGRVAARLLQSEEVRARAMSPAARRKAGAAISATKLAWCPPHLRPDYKTLVRKGVPAAEARSAIEKEIPGTPAYARRQIDEFALQQRLRAERQRAEAY